MILSKRPLPFLLIILNLFCLYTFIMEPNWIELRQVKLPTPTEYPNLKGVTFLHLSDLHVDVLSYRYKKVMQQTKEQTPDYIFVTGDIAPYRKSLAPAIEFLNGLDAKEKIVCVFGNSDYTLPHHIIPQLKETPINENILFLRNEIYETTIHNVPFYIAGLDDPISKRENFEALKSLNQQQGFKVLLMHAYYNFHQQHFLPVDLIVSGNTHGGQFNILPQQWMVKWKSEDHERPLTYLRGLHETPDGLLHVSRGLGLSFLPVRFFARPEMTYIQLV